MQVIYKIKGAPEPIIKNSRLQRKILDPYNQRKLDFQMQLLNQHNGPKLTGAWTMDAHFLFPPTNQHHKFHTAAPSITQLLRFIDEIAHGVIYDNECIISEIKAWKDYAQEIPETTLIFTRR